jgi:hypothetical protein
MRALFAVFILAAGVAATYPLADWLAQTVSVLHCWRADSPDGPVLRTLFGIAAECHRVMYGLVHSYSSCECGPVVPGLNLLVLLLGLVSAGWAGQTVLPRLTRYPLSLLSFAVAIGAIGQVSMIGANWVFLMPWLPVIAIPYLAIPAITFQVAAKYTRARHHATGGGNAA